MNRIQCSRKSSTMKKWIVCLSIAVWAVGSAGCYKATFVQNPASLDREWTHEEWTSHWFWGLAGEEHVDVQSICPQGVDIVRTGGNFGTDLVGALTLGIYRPRKVYLICSEGSTHINP